MSNNQWTLAERHPVACVTKNGPAWVCFVRLQKPNDVSLDRYSATYYATHDEACQAMAAFATLVQKENVRYPACREWHDNEHYVLCTDKMPPPHCGKKHMVLVDSVVCWSKNGQLDVADYEVGKKHCFVLYCRECGITMSRILQPQDKTEKDEAAPCSPPNEDGGEENQVAAPPECCSDKDGGGEKDEATCDDCGTCSKCVSDLGALALSARVAHDKSQCIMLKEVLESMITSRSGMRSIMAPAMGKPKLSSNSIDWLEEHGFEVYKHAESSVFYLIVVLAEQRENYAEFLGDRIIEEDKK